ncbi:CVNH domain-containing protein [Aspergillus multicolor]|uniref:putative glutamine-serine-proline rich protein n=1 Tax=Aspergillus multicolor TaxID=41759 RepID=UPI003CCD6B51
MASEEYYRDTKYPSQGQGHGYGSQSPMPPAGYPACPAAYFAGPQDPRNNAAYPPQNGSGYQYPPQEYYGGYQQPPPPYHDYPPSQTPGQAPYQYAHSPQPQQPQQHQPTYPQDAPQSGPGQPQDPNERGFMGALAGGAAGAYAGHQVNHGVLGTLGGAIVGSLGQDAIKQHHEKKEKKSKSKWGFHRRDSSSSSSSSDSGKHHAKPPVPVPAPALARAPAPTNHRGNFSHSSRDISLQGNYELVASCHAVSGQLNHSKLSLNSVLTNEFGHFKWKSGGNFGASARHARLTEGGRVLEAELADGRGGWRRDWIRLDERITNQDGVLVFLD